MNHKERWRDLDISVDSYQSHQILTDSFSTNPNKLHQPGRVQFKHKNEVGERGKYPRLFILIKSGQMDIHETPWSDWLWAERDLKNLNSPPVNSLLFHPSINS